MFKLMMNKQLEIIKKIKNFFFKKQFLRYFLVAVIAYIIDFSMFVFSFFISSNLIISNILAKVATSISGYILHSKYTYKIRLFSNTKTLILYFGTVLIYTPVATYLLIFFVNFFHHNIAKIISDCILFILIYFFTSHFIFEKKPS